MKIFRKIKAKKEITSTARELSQVDLDKVSGGINPQPLPPAALRF
jgi:hypothetical protein